MSCNLIFVQGGKKLARPVTSREEYLALRGSSAQLANLRLARAGNDAAKRRLVQFNYSGHYPQGVVKGTKLPSKAFGFDLDDKEEFEKAAAILLSEPETYGLLMLERSARQGGHAVFRREQGKTILENQVRIATLLNCEMDTSAHDINRVYFTTSGSEEDLLYLSDELFTDAYNETEVMTESRTLEEREKYGKEVLPEGAHKVNKHFKTRGQTLSEPTAHLPLNGEEGLVKDDQKESVKDRAAITDNPGNKSTLPIQGEMSEGQRGSEGLYLGIPYDQIIKKWWELYNDGQEPVKSNRNTLTFELAVNLRHICGFDREVLDMVIPCYDGFSEQEKMACIDSALAEKRTQMPKRLKDVLTTIRSEELGMRNGQSGVGNDDFVSALDGALQADELYHFDRLPKMPQGVRDSIDAAGHPLAMPTLIAIAPAIGALATGVKLDVHGKARGLNLCSFVVGEFASGKGQMDDIIAAWMAELQAETDIYTQQEDEWASKTKRMKSGKAPEQPKLPVRMLTLNNTVANIAERLANTEGKHSFSFTPEADNVALKWKQSVSDFSVMLRQAYDEARYDREAKSADAVRVHIQKLLWNVTMCGTQDALYRVITNYTDGLLSRLAIARTPDNTFSPLAENPAQMTDLQQERIQQVAHLLPLMTGTVVLPKLEERGRQWLETIRLEAMKNDDRVLARQRMRGCVNAQRITAALWLPKVAELLIKKHGMNGAELRLKKEPELWVEMLRKQQTDEMLQLFDIVADYLIDNDLYYFRDRIEQAYESKNYQGNASAIRARKGKNDNIFERLGDEFTFEQALQQSMAVKGTSASRNSVHQMLKNWRKQGLVLISPEGRYKKN